MKIKIKVGESVGVVNTLGTLTKEQLGDVQSKTTSIFKTLMPIVREFNTALELMQRNAQGKTQLEASQLQSAIAFESLAREERVVDVPLLNDEDFDGLMERCKDFKMSNYAILFPVIEHEREEKKVEESQA